MGNPLRKIFKGDACVWFVFLALLLLSALQVFSAISYLAYQAQSYVSPIRQHVSYLFLGFAIVLLLLHVSIFSPRKNFFRIISYFGLILSWGLLMYVLTLEKMGGASRFLSVFGVSFQPSEFAKFFLIVVVADLLDAKKCLLAQIITRFKGSEFLFSQKQQFWLILSLTFFTCLIIGVENLSTALLLGGVIFVMLTLSQISMKWVLNLLFIAVLLLGTLWGISKLLPQISDSDNIAVQSTVKFLHRTTTWASRIDGFFASDDENKFLVTDKTRQVVHAQRAIARGGFFKIGPGTSIERDYLPNAYNDFIYAIVIEEYGLLGGCIVIFLFLLLFMRSPAIAWRQSSIYTSMLVFGSVFMITFQVIINMAVSVNLGPVTGQPLPLISKGGTSILFICIYFGIILNLSDKSSQRETIVELNDKKDEEFTILD